MTCTFRPTEPPGAPNYVEPGYDIADLYKAELTIPLAFSLHASPQPEADARRSFRDGLRLFKLLPRIVTDIQKLLAPGQDIATPDPREQLVDLWDPVAGALPGGVNYGGDEMP